MAKVFLDTNVLVYAIDRRAPAKRKRALEVIEGLARSRSGVISTQVLQEFYAAATRKLGVDPLAAKSNVRHFRNFDIVQVTPDMIEDAIDCSILNQTSFWDGLIVTAAAIAGCTELLSEDMNAGQSLLGVTITNPFTA